MNSEAVDLEEGVRAADSEVAGTVEEKAAADLEEGVTAVETVAGSGVASEVAGKEDSSAPTQ